MGCFLRFHFPPGSPIFWLKRPEEKSLKTFSHLTMCTGAMFYYVAFISLLPQVFSMETDDFTCSGCMATATHALVQRDVSKRHLHVADRTHVPRACHQRKEDDCEKHALCAWSTNHSRCQAKIAWFHVMKCGSSFGTTLAHFANHSLPALAHVPSCLGSIADVEEDSCHIDQGPKELFVYKYPLQEWFSEAFWSAFNDNKSHDPGSHKPIVLKDYDAWKGHFVGFFRSPESQLASAFNHFVASSKFPDNITHRNTTDFETFVAGHETRYLAKYAEMSQGLVTKMLTGVFPDNGMAPIKCQFGFDNWLVEDPECTGQKCRWCLQKPDVQVQQLALERLDGFAFVGLLDYYDLSLCLFHAMFGGECRAVEFMNTRKSWYHKNYSVDLEEMKWTDPYDEQIWDKVSRTFWANVHFHKLTAKKCQHICPSANSTFHGAPEDEDAEN